MKINRVMIAAPKSGSGKTTITCALLQTMKDMGEKVVAFKCGPDYIDPMFHKKVIDIPSKNLDTFFTGEEETKELFLKSTNEGEFAILEGVMGLFDGLGGIREEGSSYHLAKITRTPIILVIDAKGMGRSLIPLIKGFLSYDREKLIIGIILNRISKSYYEVIKPLIEDELHVDVVGFFKEYKKFGIQSRHLGLMMPDEIQNLKVQLEQIAQEFQKNVVVEKITDIAKAAQCLESDITGKYDAKEYVKDLVNEQRPVIAVAKDEAFCFYYEDNLRLLREYGADIKFFSPIHDVVLPDGCSGILLGGGYPELYCDMLSKNKKMLEQIKDKADSNIPLVAECGGFMYLHSQIIDENNNSYSMAGVIDGKCYFTGKLVRFGYIELKENKDNFLGPGEWIKGHEFHYYDSECNGDDAFAVKPVTGKSYPCVISDENCFVGFPHLYYPSNPSFARKFVDKARKYMKEKSR